MTIETLAVQGRDRIHTGLAGIDTQRLKAMRNASLQSCFNRMEETRYLESTKGGLIWIADAPKSDVDYSRLVPPALRKVRMLLIVGGDSECMRKSFSGVIPTIEACPSMADALQKAYRYEADDVKVLYSPACDNGQPVEDCGNAFRQEVNEL